MSTNFVAGLVSGLDTTGLIDALVTSRSGPILLLEKRQAEKTAQLSAWKSFEAVLIGLQVETGRLGGSTLWETPRVASSDEEILTAVAESTASAGTYDLFVDQLAQAHQIQSAAYNSRTEAVGSGTLSITVGSGTTDLTVAAGATLEDLANQINDAQLGASAAIVRSDTGGAETYYLVLTSDETGTASTISVTSGLTGGTDPVLATEVRAAQNAHLRFGGETGLVLESTTNVFEDVVQGVDVTLQRAMTTGERLTLEVGRDSEGLADAVSLFVDAYNSMVSFVNDQFRFDPEVGVRPPLMGDGTLTMLAGSLRSLVTAPLARGTGTYRSPFSIGMRTSGDGTLSFDRAKFQSALEDDYDSVADLFRANASFDAAGIRMLNAPDSVELLNRAFDVDITQSATRASVTGVDFRIVGQGVKIDDANDAFRIEVDGVMSEDLRIAQGTYNTHADLAAAIQAAIEGSANLGGLDVQVTAQDLGGRLGSITLTSSQYGADHTLQLLDSGSSDFKNVTGLANEFGVLAAGTDVAGTINGVDADGSGQVLSVRTDDEELAGLSFLVTADAPTTFAATFTEGVGRTLSRRVLSLTDAVDGTVARVGSSIQRMIDAMDRDIEAKQDQLEAYRVRLKRRYARLEATLGELQSQGAFVAAQFESLSFNLND